MLLDQYVLVRGAENTDGGCKLLESKQGKMDAWLIEWGRWAGGGIYGYASDLQIPEEFRSLPGKYLPSCPEKMVLAGNIDIRIAIPIDEGQLSFGRPAHSHLHFVRVSCL